MRKRLTALILAIILALTAMPVLHAVSPVMSHASMLQHDGPVEHEGSREGDSDAAKALPAAAAVCCPAPALTAANKSVCIPLAEPIAWRLAMDRKPCGRSPLLDPRPPRL